MCIVIFKIAFKIYVKIIKNQIKKVFENIMFSVFFFGPVGSNFFKTVFFFNKKNQKHVWEVRYRAMWFLFLKTVIKNTFWC